MKAFEVKELAARAAVKALTARACQAEPASALETPQRQWAARPRVAALGRSSQSRSRQVRTWKIKTNRAKSRQVTSHNVDSVSRMMTTIKTETS